jgi:GDPmannose 4,6-dehydratase
VPASIDVTSRDDVAGIVADWNPTEIYYLAAVHKSSEEKLEESDARLFSRSLGIHVTGPINFLDVLLTTGVNASFFYASSSMVFGEDGPECQNEQTPLRPDTVYGITKSAGTQACRYFRSHHHLRASVGFLYTHESPLRRPGFVSQKVVHGALSISRGEQDSLTIGDLSARIDWGYASDFIDAMIGISCLDHGDDFVVATGEAHSVQEFVDAAFSCVGLDWRSYVREDASLLARRRATRIGDSSRLRERTGWQPSISFKDMVESLVKAAAEARER